MNPYAIFQHFMSDVFWDLLDHSIIIYIDDILIFLTSIAEHEQHVRPIYRDRRKIIYLQNSLGMNLGLPQQNF